MFTMGTILFSSTTESRCARTAEETEQTQTMITMSAIDAKEQEL